MISKKTVTQWRRWTNTITAFQREANLAGSLARDDDRTTADHLFAAARNLSVAVSQIEKAIRQGSASENKITGAQRREEEPV